MPRSLRTTMASTSRWLSAAAILVACSGSDAAPLQRARETSEVLPLTGLDAGAAALVAFVDEATGFETLDVHDATREIVHFDAARGAMVSADGSA